MKLWILRPVDDLPEDDNPWEPWYDKAFGFIVAAESESKARELASENAGDENRGEFSGRRIAETKTPWLDARYSSCKELVRWDSGVVMQDFRAA